MCVRMWAEYHSLSTLSQLTFFAILLLFCLRLTAAFVCLKLDSDQTYSLAYRVILVFFGTPYLIDCAENNKFPMIPVLVS